MSPTAAANTFRMMLGTGAMILEHIALARKYRHEDSYREALEAGAHVFQDFAWAVSSALAWDGRAGRRRMGAPPEDSPEARIEAMRGAKEFYRAIISRWLRGFPGIVIEDEERFQELALNVMQAVGDFMRENRRVLDERRPFSWTDALEKEFDKYLKLRGKRRKP